MKATVSTRKFTHMLTHTPALLGALVFMLLMVWADPAYSLFMNNTLDQKDIAHRAQFNMMLGFKPRSHINASNDNESAFTTSLFANYKIMEDTTTYIEAPNFMSSSSSGATFFPNVGGGVRHRFEGIPEASYDLDVFSTLRFPNQFIIFSPGGSLVAHWFGLTWYLEPSIDFIFPSNSVTRVSLALKFDVEYPLWTWLTVHMALYRAAGINSAFFPTVVTDPTKVVDHVFFANFGLQLRINDRILGHIDTALGAAPSAKPGNLSNIIVGAQYLL